MIAYILLQAGQGSGGFSYQSLIMFGAIFIIFYFFMIRPQQKKQKDHKTFVTSLKKGDWVVTIGGLHGRVVSVEDDAVTLDVDRGVKMKFEKTAISSETTSKKYAAVNSKVQPVQAETTTES